MRHKFYSERNFTLRNSFIPVLNIISGALLFLILLGLFFPLSAVGAWLIFIGVKLNGEPQAYLSKARTTHKFLIPLELLLVYLSFVMIDAAEASAAKGGGLLGGLGYFFLFPALFTLFVSLLTIFTKVKEVDDLQEALETETNGEGVA